MLIYKFAFMNSINYTDEGNGKIIIFIHGLSDTLHYWDSLTAKLINNYRIIRYDLRGHGKSGLGAEDITIDTYTDDLYYIFEKLNVSQANIVGFSLGSSIALNFAAKYPDKVLSLILISSIDHLREDQISIFKNLENKLNNSFEDYFDTILPMIYCPNFIEKYKNELETIKEYASDIVDCNAFIKAIDAIISLNIEDKVKQISTPTLMFAGKYDDISPLDTQKIICQNIKKSKLIVFENVKHNLLVEDNTKRFYNILEKFLLKQVID